MTSDDLDVVIVGAGLSGIGAAYRLTHECPGLSYAVLEGRSDLGGTWDLFRYPGIRSDSDMATFGYPFRPWTGDRWFGDGPAILRYIRETAEENGIDRAIRFEHKVRRAEWSSEAARWTLHVEVGDRQEERRLTCRFLFVCSGYYSYEAGYTPEIPGLDSFAGRVVHPQDWPEDLDHAGQRVVVIGSGATAVTLIPAMAETTAHITMLQRSPTYVLPLIDDDPLTHALHRWVPRPAANRILRVRNMLATQAFYQLSRRLPGLVRRVIRKANELELKGAVPVDPHFTPRYDPWDQRVCFAPNGDLFRVLREGKASVVTDTIDTITEHGIRLSSGAELEADIIVTATGLELLTAGGIRFVVDGAPVEAGDSLVFRGWGLSGVPNAAMCVGYTNASWTLRADLTAREVCRLLNHMEEHGYEAATPRPADPDQPRRPVLDLMAGYVQRAAGTFPQQGSKAPWVMRHNYLVDLLDVRFGRLTAEIDFTPKGRGRSRTSAPPRVPVGASRTD